MVRGAAEPLAIGKVRRLQQCATAGGVFVILAVDHRDNLQEYLRTAQGREVSYQDMVDFKLDVVAATSRHVSAVLLDPIYGAAPALRTGAVPGDTGMLVCIEQSGYLGPSTRRQTDVLADWSGEKIARMGGTGVKMLVHYNPAAPNVGHQLEVVQEVAEQCRRHELPFFLEPIAYPLDPGGAGLSSAERRRIVIGAAEQLTPLGVDVLKAEFPIDIAQTPDEGEWADACAELTEASRVPWVLLSAGVGFADFARQTRVACGAGASGVMVGRAVWREAIDLVGDERRRFLEQTAAKRLEILASISSELGRPWHSPLPGDGLPDRDGLLDPDWYRRY
jgi:tagatose 1,6-diphosphate aldolase